MTKAINAGKFLPVSSYPLILPTANRGIETYRLEVEIFSNGWWEKPMDEVFCGGLAS